MSVDGSQKQSSKPGVDFVWSCLFLKVCNSVFRNSPSGGFGSSVKV